MTLPAGIAAKTAILQQNVALSIIKNNAEQQRAIANVIAQAAESVAPSGRGGNVNISA